MIVSHTHRWVIVHVPKCAGTSIRYLLDEYAEHPSTPLELSPKTASVPPEERDAMREAAKRLSPPIKIHATPREIKRQFPAWASYSWYGVRRNPWDRFVSIYEFLRLRKPHRHASTFEDFMHHLPAEYTRPQAEWLDGCRVLSFEVLREALPKWASEVGLTLPETIPRYNATPERRPYWEYYTEATDLIVRQVAAPDIAAGCYTLDKETFPA